VSLQAQIDAVLVRLAATTQRIQELTEENKALRREIAVLRRQGVRQTVLQPA
jgi:cell division protein FtsB